MPLGVPRREISEVVRAWESNVKYKASGSTARAVQVFHAPRSTVEIHVSTADEKRPMHTHPLP